MESVILLQVTRLPLMFDSVHPTLSLDNAVRRICSINKEFVGYGQPVLT